MTSWVAACRSSAGLVVTVVSDMLTWFRCAVALACRTSVAFRFCMITALEQS